MRQAGRQSVARGRAGGQGRRAVPSSGCPATVSVGPKESSTAQSEQGADEPRAAAPLAQRGPPGRHDDERQAEVAVLLADVADEVQRDRAGAVQRHRRAGSAWARRGWPRRWRSRRARSAAAVGAAQSRGRRSARARAAGRRRPGRAGRPGAAYGLAAPAPAASGEGQPERHKERQVEEELERGAELRQEQQGDDEDEAAAARLAAHVAHAEEGHERQREDEHQVQVLREQCAPACRARARRAGRRPARQGSCRSARGRAGRRLRRRGAAARSISTL